MFIFVCTALSVKPLILIPGLMGSQIYSTYGKNFHQEWYCTKKANNKVAWLNPSFLIPPRYNCLFNMLEVKYNKNKQTFESKPNLKMFPHDFGGVDGISTLIDVGDIKLIESFSHMVKYMKDKGYVVGKTLFGVPYDWRLAYVGLYKGTLNNDIKNLVIKAYNENNEKVTILGYSLGSIITTQFLGRCLTEAEKKKYVEKVIFLAPAFSGAGEAVSASWFLRFPVLDFIQSEYIENAIRNLPCIHVLFPNYKVYEDTVIIKGPNGEKVYPSGVINFLAEHGKLTGDSLKMARLNEEMILENEPLNPKVPLMFIYNSGISTKMGLNFKNGYDNDPVSISVDGDGTVPAKGVKWACEHFASTENPVLCYDMSSSDSKFNHMGLGDNEYVNDLIYKYVNVKDWHLKGVSAYYKPTNIRFLSNTTYTFGPVHKQIITPKYNK